MDNKYDELIAAFESKLRRLIVQYRLLQDENAMLRQEIHQKKEDLMLAHQEVLQLRNDYSHLRIAKALSLTEDERLEAKKRIDKMVREVDRCLALLDE